MFPLAFLLKYLKLHGQKSGSYEIERYKFDENFQIHLLYLLKKNKNKCKIKVIIAII